MKTYYLRFTNDDFTQDDNVWTTETIDLYSNEQYHNFSTTKSIYGLNLLGNGVWTGIHYTPGDPPSSESGFIYDDRFVDTTGRIDIERYSIEFAEAIGEQAIDPVLAVYTTDDENSDFPDEWAVRTDIRTNDQIAEFKSYRYARFELTLNTDMDISSLEVEMFVRVRIDVPVMLPLYARTRNVLDKFPGWMAVRELDLDTSATPATPESLGGKLINAVAGEWLDDLAADLEYLNFQHFITTADVNQMAWAYRTIDVSDMIYQIEGDGTEIARTATIEEFYELTPDEHGFHWDRLQNIIYTNRVYDELIINGEVFTQDLHQIWNWFDEFGVLLDLPRLRSEANLNYKNRILDVFRNRPGAGMEAFKLAIRRELDLWGTEGATPDSDYLGATPEVIEIHEFDTHDDFVDPDGMPRPRFRELVNLLADQFPTTWGYFKWDRALWNAGGLENEGYKALPYRYDATPVHDADVQSGVGDNDDLLVLSPRVLPKTVDFCTDLVVRGKKKVPATIHPKVYFDVDIYGTADKRVYTNAEVEEWFTIEVLMYWPDSGSSPTSQTLYHSFQLSATSDADNYTKSTTPNSWTWYHFLDQSGFTLGDFETWYDTSGDEYGDSATPFQIDIGDIVSVKLRRGRFDPDTQTFVDLPTLDRFYAWFSNEASYLSMPASSGSYVSTPDRDILDTDDGLEIIWHGTADDWSPSALTHIAGKWNTTGDQRSWRLYLATSGALVFEWSTDGTSGNTITATSTSNLSALANSTERGIRVRFAHSSGSYAVTFETSDDYGFSWTALGSTIIGSGGAMFSGTADLYIGAVQSTTTANLWSGNVYEVIIKNAIDGNTIAHPIFSNQIITATTFRDAHNNVWTIAGSAAIAHANRLDYDDDPITATILDSATPTMPSVVMASKSTSSEVTRVETLKSRYSIELNGVLPNQTEQDFTMALPTLVFDPDIENTPNKEYVVQIVTMDNTGSRGVRTTDEDYRPTTLGTEYVSVNGLNNWTTDGIIELGDTTTELVFSTEEIGSDYPVNGYLWETFEAPNTIEVCGRIDENGPWRYDKSPLPGNTNYALEWVSTDRVTLGIPDSDDYVPTWIGVQNTNSDITMWLDSNTIESAVSDGDLEYPNGVIRESSRDEEDIYALWYEALANRRNEQASVLVIGDSISEGYTVDYMPITNRWMNLLQERMRQAYPTAGIDDGGGFGYMPARYNWAFDDNPATTATATASNAGGFGLRAYSLDATGTVTYTDVEGDIVRVWYVESSLVRALTITIDGGTTYSIPTNTVPSRINQNYRDFYMGPGAHTVVIGAASGGGFDATFGGIQVFNGDGPTDRYMRFSGGTAAYIEAPDGAALDITGDIDVTIHCALDDWTGSGEQSLISKWDSALTNQRSWRFYVNTSGALVFAHTTDGTNTTLVTTTSSAPNLVNGHAYYLRVTVDVDAGASNKTITFYKSTDGSTWETISTHTTSGTTSIFSGTGVLRIADLKALSPLLATGNFYSATVKNGIDGTIVANPDFTIQGNWRPDSAGNTWAVGSYTTTSIVTSGTKGIQFIDASKSGAKASTFTPTITGASNLFVDLSDWLLRGEVSLVMMALGTNEKWTGPTAAVYKTEMQSLITEIHSIVPEMPIVLVAWYSSDEAYTHEDNVAGGWDAFVDAMHELVEENDYVGIIDFHNDPAPGVEPDIWGLHPDEDGHQAIADALFERLPMPKYSLDPFLVNARLRGDIDERWLPNIHTGWMYDRKQEYYLYANPVTEDASPNPYVLEGPAYQGAPIIVKALEASTPYELRQVAFFDEGSTPTGADPTLSFFNTQRVSGSGTTKLFAAYNDISQIEVVDVDTGEVLGAVTQSDTNVIETDEATLRSKEYDITYHVDRSFYANHMYEDEEGQLRTQLTFSSDSTPLPLTVHYESEAYEQSTPINLPLNPFYTIHDEGFIFISHNEYDVLNLNVILSPSSITADGQDYLLINVYVYDINGNPKPNATFDISTDFGILTSNEFTTDIDGAAIITLVSEESALSVEGTITITGNNLIAEVGFTARPPVERDYRLTAIPGADRIPADGESQMYIYGRVEDATYSGVPYAVVKWKKGRYLYDIFSQPHVWPPDTAYGVTPGSELLYGHVVADSRGRFHVGPFEAATPSDTGYWFVSLESESASPTSASPQYDRVGDVVYWHEYPDSLYGIEEFSGAPLQAVQFATPSYEIPEYTEQNALPTHYDEATPNDTATPVTLVWEPPPWYAVPAYTQYQLEMDERPSYREE